MPLSDSSQTCTRPVRLEPSPAVLRLTFAAGISENIKTAAFRAALWSEGTDDHMASRLYRVGDLANVGDTVARRSKKMKDDAVVPHIVSTGPQFDFSDVGNDPAGHAPRLSLIVSCSHRWRFVKCRGR
jgi:hypothetical protein